MTAKRDRDMITVIGLAPPHYPASSVAVLVMLILIASLPPLLRYLHKRKCRIPLSRAVPLLLVYSVTILAISPEINRLSVGREAIQNWFEYGLLVLAVSTFATYGLRYKRGWFV